MALTERMKSAMMKAMDAFEKQADLREKRVRFTFTAPVLGSSPSNKELHSEYIASKAPDAPSMEEEVAMIGADEVEAKQMTVFPRFKDEYGIERICVLDYQIKGMFKDYIGGLRRVKGTISSKVTAYKKVVDKNIFIKERKIPFFNIDNIDSNQRALRGNAGGQEIVALANSEQLEEGCSIEFTIVYSKDLEDLIVECLNYGIYAGFLQWRNGGYGKYIWEELSEAGEVIGGNFKTA